MKKGKKRPESERKGKKDRKKKWKAQTVLVDYWEGHWPQLLGVTGSPFGQRLERTKTKQFS